jgi:hypothetical protein
MSIVLWKTKKLQLRNLHASQTLGWSWNWNTYTWLIDKKFASVRVSVRFRCDRRPSLVFLTQTVYKSVLPWPVVRLPKPSVAQTVGCPNRRLPKPSVAQPSVSQTVQSSIQKTLFMQFPYLLPTRPVFSRPMDPEIAEVPFYCFYNGSEIAREVPFYKIRNSRDDESFRKI